MTRFPLLRTCSALVLLGLAVEAQDLPRHGVVQTEITRALGASVPQPPRVLLQAPPSKPTEDLPSHGRMTLPDGPPGLPQPVVPPIELDAPHVLSTAGDLVTSNVSTTAALGMSQSTSTLEPTVTSPDNLRTLFSTGNWYASYSQNSGQSWFPLSPYTTFPALGAGFCCDQWAVSRNGATFWYLQYAKNSAGNAVRVAISPTVADLRVGHFPRSWAFTAQTFGFGSGLWLDFPDLATTNGYVLATSNVFDQSDVNQGNVVWRMKIADMIAGLPNVTFDYYTGSAGRGHRLAHGAEDTMYLASPLSYTSISISKWPDAAVSRTQFTRTISQWSYPTGFLGNPGPDNLPWTGKVDTRLFGGFYAPPRFRESARYGFYWTSNPIGTYTTMHVRGVVLEAGNDTVVEQPIIWNPNYACAYPAVHANGFGHRGVVFAYGGGTVYPSAACQVDDDLGSASITFGTGAAGPSTNRWGDYYAVHSGGGYNTHPQFLCVGGIRLNSTLGVFPVTARVMREGFSEAGIGVAVLTYPTTVQAWIPMAPADRFGQSNAYPPYYRSVNFSSGSYTFYGAPRGLDTANNRSVAFVRWHRKFAPNQAHQAQPDGVLNYTMTTGNATFPTELVAEYTPLYAINVTSNAPGQLTLAPADFAGRTSSSLPYTAEYVAGSRVTLTASASNSNNDVFDHWEIDGLPYPAGQLSVTVSSLSRDRNAQVVYRRFYYGQAFFTGYGCPGISRNTPTMQISAVGTGGIRVGAPTDYDLFAARASTPVSLVLGLSDTTWGSTPLPLDLGPLGAVGCYLRNDPLVMFPATTTASGTARLSVTWPNDPVFVRSVHYASWVVVDPANRLGIVMSDSWVALLGGWQ